MLKGFSMKHEILTSSIDLIHVPFFFIFLFFIGLQLSHLFQNRQYLTERNHYYKF